jgi:uncharacterized membrane-anchored protein
MQQSHIPTAGTRYWAALSIASVFGANTGDFVAKYFHLGHAGGLLPLAAILAIIFVAERRDSSVHQAYYWLAIIVVRTAATNLADFAASDMALKKIWLIAALAALLALLLLVSAPAKSQSIDDAAGPQPFRLPTTDARYWAAMLVAGTLGTVIGDTTSFDSGLGTGYASLVLGSLLGLAFLLGAIGLFANVWFYWLTVVMVRAAGTSLSDFLAHNVFGLPLSTLVTGVLFVGTLLLWREEPPYRLRSREAA